MKNTSIIALRWLGIVPCAFISYIVGYGISKLIVWVNFANPDDWYQKFIIAVGCAGLGGFLFVALGTMMAPNNQKYFAIVLTILLPLSVVAVILFNLITPYRLTILEGIASVLGGFGGYFLEVDYERNKR